jgi:hypothetical protein
LVDEAAYERLFDLLVDLPSYNFKGPVPKMMRWYAWWDGFQFHHAELWANKGILRYSCQFADVDDISVVKPVLQTPEAELRQLKSQSGGFKLAYRMITTELDYYSRGLFIVGQECWSTHASRAENIKTPKHAIKNYIKLSRGGWQAELVGISHRVCDNVSNLEFMGVMIPTGTTWEPVDGYVKDVFALQLRVQSNRAWSMKLDVEVPPVRYSGVMDVNAVARRRDCEKMQREHLTIMHLEADRHSDAWANNVRRAIYWLDYAPVRFMYLLFERGGFSEVYAPFLKYMRYLHEVIPDSRIVEATLGKYTIQDL